MSPQSSYNDLSQKHEAVRKETKCKLATMCTHISCIKNYRGSFKLSKIPLEQRFGWFCESLLYVSVSLRRLFPRCRPGSDHKEATGRNGAHQGTEQARKKPTWTSFDPVSVPPAAALLSVLSCWHQLLLWQLEWVIRSAGRNIWPYLCILCSIHVTTHRLCLIQTHLTPWGPWVDSSGPGLSRPSVPWKCRQATFLRHLTAIIAQCQSVGSALLPWKTASRDQTQCTEQPLTDMPFFREHWEFECNQNKDSKGTSPAFNWQDLKT